MRKIIFLISLTLINLLNTLKTSNSNSNSNQNSNEEELNQNENEILFHLKNDKRYDEIITNKWTRDLAIAYRDWAGLGYLTKDSAESQLSEIKKGQEKNKSKISFFFRKFIELGNWEHIFTFTGDKEIQYFSYSIFRNINLGKLICTFSGTKGPKQLLQEYFNSNLKTFFRTKKNQNLSKMKIMDYMNNLYSKINEQLYEKISAGNSAEIKQIIFTGHSLGGAIASIAALDLVQSNLIKKSEGEIPSPILITYGQPRTGNFVFANEIKKKIPLIFRHANNYDVIVNMPFCYKDNKDLCVNEYEKKKLDENFSDYENIKINEKLIDNNFAWHTEGLILNTDDENSLDCREVSEVNEGDEKCKVQKGVMIAFHSYYYGFKVSDFFKPEIFKYYLDEISCSLKDLVDIYDFLPGKNLIKTFDGYLRKFDFGLGKSRDNENEVNRKLKFNSNKICYYFLKIFRYFGGIE